MSMHPPAEPGSCDDCSEGPRLPRHVRLATGEFVWQEVDLNIAGRGLDFTWTRTYRSRPEPGLLHFCRAFRGSGQAQERVFSLWVNDFTGVAQSGASTTRAQVQFWFAGPDNATNINSKSIIFTTLDDVFDAIKSDDFDIDCEGGGGTCSSANAYVTWGGSDVNLCNAFFNSGFSRSKRAAILIHELTHAYNDTDDYFYYPTDGSTMPWNFFTETTTLRENADTYEQFTLSFFLP